MWLSWPQAIVNAGDFRPVQDFKRNNRVVCASCQDFRLGIVAALHDHLTTAVKVQSGIVTKQVFLAQ